MGNSVGKTVVLAAALVAFVVGCIYLTRRWEPNTIMLTGSAGDHDEAAASDGKTGEPKRPIRHAVHALMGDVKKAKNELATSRTLVGARSALGRHAEPIEEPDADHA
jgi:hypothetical protein